MKILFVTQSLGKGGAERLTLELAHQFQTFPGVKVLVVPLAPQNDYQDLSKGLDIRICNSFVHLSLTGKSQIHVAEYENIVDEFQPDVIHSHTYKAELVSRENIRLGIVYVSHVHSDFAMFDPFHFFSLLKKQKITNYYERLRIFRRYTKAKNIFITVSRSTNNHLKFQLPTKWHHSIYLVSNGVDLSKFNRSPSPILKEGTVKLINIGRFFPIKNQRYLVDVLSKLKKNSTRLSFELTLVGDGPDLKEVLEYAKSQGVNDLIKTTGMVNDPETHLKSAHLYLHSSLSESFGLVLIEAMAAGLPVICLNGGGNADLILHGENGFLLPSNSTPENFADHVLKLVVDSERYHQMALYAHNFAQQFSIQYTAIELFNIYKGRMESTNKV